MHRECFGPHSWSDYEYMLRKYVISSTSNPVVIAEPKKHRRVPVPGEQGLSRQSWKPNYLTKNWSPNEIWQIRHALWNVSDGALGRMADPGAAMWCKGWVLRKFEMCGRVPRKRAMPMFSWLWSLWQLQLGLVQFCCLGGTLGHVMTSAIHSCIAWWLGIKPSKQQKQVLTAEKSPIAFIILHGMQINVFAKKFQSFKKCTEVSSVRPKASESNTFAAKFCSGNLWLRWHWQKTKCKHHASFNSNSYLDYLVRDCSIRSGVAIQHG